MKASGEGLGTPARAVIEATCQQRGDVALIEAGEVDVDDRKVPANVEQRRLQCCAEREVLRAERSRDNRAPRRKGAGEMT